MDDLMLWLSGALEGSVLMAFTAALLWGVTSVILSPCHLGTIPLVVAYVGMPGPAGRPSRARASILSFSFAGGMLVAVAILGVLVATAGWAVGGLGRYTNYVIGAIFLLAGLHLIGLLPLPDSGTNVTSARGKGPLAAATLGLVFGIGLSPCTFAFLAPVLGVSFGSASTSPALGALLLLTFGVGHCGVIGLAGTSVGLVQRTLDWNERSKGLSILRVVCGVLLLASAAVLFYTA